MAMTRASELRRRLASVPDPDPPASDLEDGIAASVSYLGSDAAMRSLEADAYWPKWDSPWWHMLLLFELGEARRIPSRAVDRLVQALDALPVKIFPIREDDWPEGADRRRDSHCHCSLGCVTQVLLACGVDVDRALPWARPWFVRYQMADGGLNCDETAYLVEDECPSSMVGTVAPFEAMQRLGAAGEPPTAAFLERAAGFLVGRQLVLGSATRHNGVEREREASWLEPCFPRFYFYDVLRGLAALVGWAGLAGRAVPLAAIAPAALHMVTRFPDGVVRLGRRAYEGWGTLACDASGGWSRAPRASTFPLLEAASAVGRPSAPVTRQWTETRRRLVELLDAGRISDATA